MAVKQKMPRVEPHYHSLRAHALFQLSCAFPFAWHRSKHTTVARSHQLAWPIPPDEWLIAHGRQHSTVPHHFAFSCEIAPPPQRKFTQDTILVRVCWRGCGWVGGSGCGTGLQRVLRARVLTWEKSPESRADPRLPNTIVQLCELDGSPSVPQVLHCMNFLARVLQHSAGRALLLLKQCR
jgi:hypothetical protein